MGGWGGNRSGLGLVVGFCYQCTILWLDLAVDSTFAKYLIIWSIADRGWLRFRNGLRNLLEFSKKMKFYTCFLLLTFSIATAEWIEPPSRSDKG